MILGVTKGVAKVARNCIDNNGVLLSLVIQLTSLLGKKAMRSHFLFSVRFAKMSKISARKDPRWGKSARFFVEVGGCR